MVLELEELKFNWLSTNERSEFIILTRWKEDLTLKKSLQLPQVFQGVKNVFFIADGEAHFVSYLALSVPAQKQDKNGSQDIHFIFH